MKNEALHSDNTPSYVAGAALARYTVVKADTTRNQVVQAAANSDKVIGVTQQSAASGEPVAIKRGGYAKVLVGSGGRTKGAKLTPATGGGLVATTTNGHFVCAIAEEAASAGEYGEVYLLPVPMLYSAMA